MLMWVFSLPILAVYCGETRVLLVDWCVDNLGAGKTINCLTSNQTKSGKTHEVTVGKRERWGRGLLVKGPNIRAVQLASPEIPSVLTTKYPNWIAVRI